MARQKVTTKTTKVSISYNPTKAKSANKTTPIKKKSSNVKKRK